MIHFLQCGFLDVYSSCVILLLICWLTIHMFVLAVFKCNHKSRKLEVGGVIISLIIPIAISTIPFNDLENGIMYGLAGKERNILRFLVTPKPCRLAAFASVVKKKS